MERSLSAGPCLDIFEENPDRESLSRYVTLGNGSRAQPPNGHHASSSRHRLPRSQSSRGVSAIGWHVLCLHANPPPANRRRSLSVAANRSGAALTQPLLSTVKGLWSSVAAWRDINRRGAVSIPRIPDRYGRLGLETLATLGRTIKVGYPAQSFHKWFKQYGNTVMVTMLYEDRIITSEPQYVKAVLATEFDNYWKGPVDGYRGLSLLGTGVFNVDGEMWKFHRSMTRPYFSRDRITDFDTFDKYSNDVLNLAVNRLREGYPVDIQDVAARFTLDSATAFLFGASVDSTSAGLAYPQSASHLNSAEFLNHPSNSFVTAFIEGQRFHVDRSRFGSKWQLGEFWKDLIQPHREVMDQFIEPIIQRALSQKAQGIADKKEEPETLLGHLLLSTEDKSIIRDEILNMLVAGRDTTAATITFAIYMLADHPDKARRLREEILNQVGPTRRPTHDDIKNMPYLRAFINETLRLYPPVPIDARSSINATTWPSTTPGGPPLYVPGNTKIVYTVFLMHRRKDLWGPTALEFDPDRFIDERLGKYLTPNPYIFLPFNAGPRICLGQQFAYQESSFFLVRLLQRFSAIHLAPDVQPESSKPPPHWKHSELKKMEKITYGTSLTMYAKDGLWVRMEPA
ncbi:Glycosyltransferase family 39 protein [Mycena indigotica]|uniref:Glycosyltransferase family 39 protein n=1 Tax=Mycena indigotica TaxID=2126181 RepID=A0A8H6SJW6_9AGAR|nr:Glycosyltransferase family 39 protein [Mycena indigotica]KAF7301055.1 Glycosyltransferase family 39 protein [Mycena indigotica]